MLTLLCIGASFTAGRSPLSFEDEDGHVLAVARVSDGISDEARAALRELCPVARVSHLGATRKDG